MSSEINTHNIAVSTNQIGGSRGTKATAKQIAPTCETEGKVEAPAKETVSVNVTDQANRLREIEEQLSGIPVVDTQKVEAVRQSIADGTFEIDPQRVAEKLLAFESGK